MTIVCPIPPLEWGEADLLYNTASEDSYYSKADGLAESQTVFLKACGLPDRWEGRPQFTIGELGFGTGLNFLATWQLWSQHRRADQLLHYISVEHQPLDAETMLKANARWPDLQQYVARLVRRLPPRHHGFHRIAWTGEGLLLTLCYGDAHQLLQEFSAACDAWFLDGFAPSRNPRMWTDPLLALVAQQSAPGACVGTYSSAGAVRRGLRAAGFNVEKKPGFGAKRERLVGQLESKPAFSQKQPWFGSAHPRTSAPQSATVIGAGVSGRCVARQLTARGVHVTLLSDGCSGGSQVPVAVLKPRLTADQTLPGELQWLAFLHAHQFYNQLDSLPTTSGALDLAADAEATNRAHRLLTNWGLEAQWMQWVSASQASRIAGLPLNMPALYQPQALVLPSAQALEAIWPAEHIVSGRAASLRPMQSQWQVLDEHGALLNQSTVVVLAGGVGSVQLPFSEGLPLRALKGQLSGVSQAGPQAVVAHKGFVTPSVDGLAWVGATYDHVDPLHWRAAPRIEQSAHQRNLANASAFVDAADDDPAGFAGLRAITPDHLPIVGPAPAWEAIESAYARVHHGESWREFPPCPVNAGCYWLTGMGSRGYLFAPLLAEFLTDQVCGSPWSLARKHADLLHPVRFALRQLRRHGKFSARLT